MVSNFTWEQTWELCMTMSVKSHELDQIEESCRGKKQRFKALKHWVNLKPKSSSKGEELIDGLKAIQRMDLVEAFSKALSENRELEDTDF